MEDGKIIELYYQRRQTAIAETDRKYGQLCRDTACNILSNREDSEECVSDTYLALWNNIPPEYPRHFCSYILGILRKKAVSLLRVRYADRRGGGEYALCLDELEQSIGADSDPQGELEARELAAAISRVLGKLSKADRAIFVSRYWLMEPVREIAAAACCSEAKVKSSLHRSREKIKKQLQKEGLL